MTCVLDWNDVCLVCLQKGGNCCVFQNENGSDISIADKIIKCSDYIFKEGENQPDNICIQCLEDLNVAFRFRQTCEQSLSMIKSILNSDNRELEVSGLRIKIPAGINIKKVQSSSEKYKILKHELAGNTIKDEEDPECKTSYESDQFDVSDCLDHLEVLEEEHAIEEEETEALQNPIEDEIDEKLELIPELTDEKPPLVPVRKYNKKNQSSLNTPKRGRGRPKKVFDRMPKLEPTSPEPGEVIQMQIKKPKVEDKPQKICDICGNSYKYQHALNSHMRRHRNERPFNCDFCEKAFVSAVELRRHMRVHTGQKPYECQYCDRRFSDFGSRIKHERTHTGERPYVCPTCGKSFAYAHVLTVHLRTHTGEKKYTCNECGRGFTKKSYLENHMTHHVTNGGPNEDRYEQTEVAVNADDQYEETKTTLNRYVVLQPNGFKPKEEDTGILLQDDYTV